MVFVSGTFGNPLRQITFRTNKRNLGPYGSQEGERSFDVDFPTCRALYFFGGANLFVDTIGVAFECPV